MSYVSPEMIKQAKEVDLFTYLKTACPEKLVHVAGNQYCTREHDSLKISNGMWFWFSRDFGGRTALDYLIKVKNMKFLDAVQTIVNGHSYPVSAYEKIPVKKKEKIILLPERDEDSTEVRQYLRHRGIDEQIINFCLDTGRVYQSTPHKNAVFVGHDNMGIPRYATIRGMGTDFIGDANGSDKRYSFNIPAEGSKTLHIFESAVDLLSFATLCKMQGFRWDAHHLVSLAGVYRPSAKLKESSFPLALKRYLGEHPEIRNIYLRLDNDPAGRGAAKALETFLSDKYKVTQRYPQRGKDFNDFLCMELGLPITHRNPKSKEKAAER